MSAIERITISLPAELAATLRASVDDGDYASTGEIVREALHDWQRAREREQRDLEELREAIRIGDESGSGIPAEEVFAELRQRIAEIAERL